MEISEEQYKKIEQYLPRQRGNVSMSNIRLINAILYITENGCKWEGVLPKSYGQLTYDLCTDEPVEQKWCIIPNFSGTARRKHYLHKSRSSMLG